MFTRSAAAEVPTTRADGEGEAESATATHATATAYRSRGSAVSTFGADNENKSGEEQCSEDEWVTTAAARRHFDRGQAK